MGERYSPEGDTTVNTQLGLLPWPQPGRIVDLSPAAQLRLHQIHQDQLEQRLRINAEKLARLERSKNQ